MGGYCPEKISTAFYKSIWCGNKAMTETFYKLIMLQDNIKVIIFKSRKDIERFLLDT